MDTTENNKLIAEFMGYKGTYDEHNYPNNDRDLANADFYKTVPFDFKPKSMFEGLELRYHSSWDWLMPVVEKISRVPNRNENGLFAYEVMFSINPITGVEVEDIYNRNFGSEKGFLKQNFYKGSLIENTYKAVVEFIKWYNSAQRETHKTE